MWCNILYYVFVIILGSNGKLCEKWFKYSQKCGEEKVQNCTYS
jgi:hypothetical protein